MGTALHRAGAVDADGVVALGLMTVRHTQGRLADLLPQLQVLAAEYDATADILALALLAAGRPDEAGAARRSPGPIRRDFFRTLFLAVRGLAVVALGDAAEADEVYAALLPHERHLAGIGTGSYVLCPVAQVLGDLAVRLDRPADAEGHYRTALDLAERCGNDHWRRAARAGLSALVTDPAPGTSGPQVDR
jgi:hypothetical protein